MSWARALHLVDSLFKSGAYRNAIIINAEFNMMDNSPFSKNFALSHFPLNDDFRHFLIKINQDA